MAKGLTGQTTVYASEYRARVPVPTYIWYFDVICKIDI